MKKVLLITILFFSGLFVVEAQHFIGIDKEKANDLARKNGFFKDNMTKSQKFNYLKFVNSADTKTLIIFFSDENISKHTRMVCDYSEYDFIISEYDEKYQRKKDLSWEYAYDNEIFTVSLEEKEWYFVVRTKKK